MDLAEPINPSQKTKKKIIKTLNKLEKEYQRKLRKYKKDGILAAEEQL